jgi:beta-N-acetylhexosaminidase
MLALACLVTAYAPSAHSAVRKKKPAVSRKIAAIEKATSKITSPQLDKDDEALIKAMPLKDKIGQMLFLGFTGTTINETLKPIIAGLKPGGLVMFGRNIKTAPQVSELNRAIQDASMKSCGLPLLVGVDQEGGNVIRIKTQYPLPAALAFGQSGDPKLVERAGVATGKLLHTLGFNMDLAPVLDVGDPNSPRFIGTRSYGSDPELVSRLGSAFSEGLQQEHILPTTKHFPGHGGVNGDSHTSLPERKATLAQMEKHDLIPFEQLQKRVEKPWAVMLAHVSYPDLDPSGEPASFSKIIVTDILRNRIGFKGVVITDDIQMAGAGIIDDVRERAVRAVEAGVDMIMITWNRKTQAAVAVAIERAVKEGRISEARINESVRRIVSAKREYAPTAKKASVEDLRLALKSTEFQSLADEAVQTVFKRAPTKSEKSYVEYAGDRPLILFSANANFATTFKSALSDRKIRTYTLSSHQSFDIDRVMRSNPEAAGVFYVSGNQIARIASKISDDVASRMLVVTVEPPGILPNADNFKFISDVYYRHPQLGKFIAQRYFGGEPDGPRITPIAADLQPSVHSAKSLRSVASVSAPKKKKRH